MAQIIIISDKTQTTVVFTMTSIQNTPIESLLESARRNSDVNGKNNLLCIPNDDHNLHHRHHSMDYHCTLLALAGAADVRHVFAHLLMRAAGSAVQDVAEAIRFEPFITKDCVRATIHLAIVRRIVSQAFGSTLGGEGYLDRAHKVVATYLLMNGTRQ